MPFLADNERKLSLESFLVYPTIGLLQMWLGYIAILTLFVGKRRCAERLESKIWNSGCGDLPNRRGRGNQIPGKEGPKTGSRQDSA